LPGSRERQERQHSRGRALLLILLLIFGIKLLLYLLDPSPKFYFGDSASYLWTAISGWIPDDRSFTYGFLLSALAIKTHSLAAVVVLQTFLGTLAAWIVSFSLLRYFQTKTWIATLAGLLCAVGPLQLISERFILTEAISTFLFAVYVLLSLEYLRSGRLVVLGAVQLVAPLLISFRLSYLPFVLAFSVLLPLLGPPARQTWTGFRRESPQWRQFGPGLVKVSTHLALAIAVSQAGLYGYRQWNGNLSNREPAYMYKDGLFLLAAMAPVVQPRDFPIPELRGPIFDHLKFNLRDPRLRIAQCFGDGGLDDLLTQKVNAKFGDDPRTSPNKLARKTALRALKRNPLGALRLTMNTWLDYFDSRYLADTVYREEGKSNKAAEGFKKEIRQNVGWEYNDAWRNSLIQRWHKIALPWYQFLMVLPILFTALTLLSRGRNVTELIYFGFASWIFMLPATVTAEPTVRYLVAFEWMTPLLLGALLTSMMPRALRRTLC
jgi:hypothetical protein